jgi:hypothetical protein
MTSAVHRFPAIPAPARAEHTEALLAGIGYSPEAIGHLRREGLASPLRQMRLETRSAGSSFADGSPALASGRPWHASARGPRSLTQMITRPPGAHRPPVQSYRSMAPHPRSNTRAPLSGFITSPATTNGAVPRARSPQPLRPPLHRPGGHSHSSYARA